MERRDSSWFLRYRCLVVVRVSFSIAKIRGSVFSGCEDEVLFLIFFSVGSFFFGYRFSFRYSLLGYLLGEGLLDRSFVVFD